MKNVVKLSVLFLLFFVVFTSCTAEDEILIEDSVESTTTDPHKKDVEPPIDPND